MLSIALVVPTYNRAHLVGQTIASALAQTSPFNDIVVVDDGSTDDTPAVLAAFGDRIRVIRTTNQGVQAARNTGIAATQSELVSVCDSDDLLEPNFNAKVVDWLARHPSVDALYCNFVLFDHQGVSAHKLAAAPQGFFDGAKCDDGVWYDVPNLYTRNLDFQPLFQCGATYRRTLLERLGGYATALHGVGAEDWELTLRAISQGSVAVTTQPLARVRRHTGNDSASQLHMLRGEIQILEYALAHHPAAREHRSRVEAEIERRRMLAFDAAFGQGKLTLAHDIANRLRIEPRDRKYALKRWITQQPSMFSIPMWRLTQVGRSERDRGAPVRPLGM